MSDSAARRCAKCDDIKPLDQFPRKRNHPTRRRGICAACEPPVPTRRREAMCGSKVRYGTQGRALGVAQSAAKRTRFLRVYECPLCHGWHLTHQPERVAS